MTQHYKYLILGGGVASYDAIKGIREMDPGGTLGLISKEAFPPYHRPYLSKKLWKGAPFESVWLNLEGLNVELYLNRAATTLDPHNKTVLDDHDDEYSYDKLLIATGGTPRRLPFGGDRILYFRDMADYHTLRSQIGQSKHFGVIGGGFIGSELAAALAMNGEKVTMIFPEEGIGSRIFPQSLALYLNDFYRSKGVEVLAGQNIVNLEEGGDTVELVTDQGKKIPAQTVIAGIGILPNLGLPKAAGLQVDRGLSVDERLRTSDPDIYAAGDITEFYQPLLAHKLRVEHEDNAQNMGRQAGRNMAGMGESYEHLSYFYSDMFELGYEAVGELDPSQEIFIDWQEPFKKGVIYYLSEARVRGVLAWNVWDTTGPARQLLNLPGPFYPENLKGRLG